MTFEGWGLGGLELRWGGLVAAVCVAGATTFLFPVLGALLAWPLRLLKPRASKPGTGAVQELDLLVPAYSEADTLELTVRSLLRASAKWVGQGSGRQIRIVVALDGPKDETPQIARKLAAEKQPAGLVLQLIDRAQNRGKWRTLEELAQASRAPWSVLVDCGTVWPEDFLIRLSPHFEGRALGVAPGYRPQSSTLLERLVWGLERSLKHLENLSGGPFTLHGATMAFRTEELRAAFAALTARAWLNDDVVLGLELRTRGEILYLGNRLCVGDGGIRPGASELGRRQRLVRGNLEWIGALFPRLVWRAPDVALLALRRVLRVFWVYQVGLTLLCLAYALDRGPLAYAGALGVGLGLLAPQRRLREAAWVSLKAPWMLVRGSGSGAWA